MGTYNSAVITNGGQSMIAQAVAGASLEFTTIKTSNYAYPAGTNLATLTTINGIKQSKDITSAAVYNSRVIKISAAVDNTGISTAYAINTIGIYAKVGSSAESLFAVVKASAADTMPAYDSKPYSYIYEINLTMQNAANVTVTVNAAGLVNVADLNAAKVEIQGEIADLKSDLNAVYIPSENLHNHATDRHGIDIDANGVPMENLAYKSTDYMYVGGGNKATIQVVSGVRRVFYYTTNNASGFSRALWLTGSETKTIELRPTEEYIVITSDESAPDFMVNLGTSLLPYVPYGGKMGQFLRKTIDEVDNAIAEVDDNILLLAQDGKTHFDKNLFVIGGLSQGDYSNNNTRVCTYPSILKFDYPIRVKSESGYRFGIHTFSESDTFIIDSGWQTDYTISANTRFRIVIAHTVPESYLADVYDYVNQISFDSKAVSLIKEVHRLPTYFYEGESLSFKKLGFDVSQMYNVPTVTGKASQGFAIYNDVIFQLYSNDKVNLIDYNDGAVIATLDIKSDHGDTIDFSNEFYDPSDEFPLAYITSDTTPAKVYVVRLSRSETQLIRTYYFGDVSKTGYYAGHCLDANNNVIYTVGYTQSSYYLADNDNKMIVSKWDLSNYVTNEDDTITPTFVKSFILPFMRTVQGQRYFRNKLFLLSSHNGLESLPVDTKIYVVDPFREIVTTVFSDFPSGIKNVECEAIEFVKENDMYNMILSSALKYNKLIFK